MRNSIFIQILKQLEHKEQQDFKVYTSSLYANNPQYIEIIDCIVNWDVSQTKVELNIEELTIAIFGNHEKIDRTKDALKQLKNIIEEYLVLLEMRKRKSFDQDFFMLNIFKRREWLHLFNDKINKVEKKMSRLKELDLWGLMYKMRLSDYKYFMINTPTIHEENKVKEAMDNLDRFFIAAKLKYSTELLSRQQILTESYHIHFLSEVKEFCGKYLPEDLYFRLQLLSQNLVLNKQKEDFYLLEKLVFENISNLHPRDLLMFFAHLTNYTATAIKNEEEGAIEESFRLHKKGVKERIFVIEGRVTPAHFHNIVNLACKLKDFEWIEEFVEYWKYYLDKKNRSSTVSIAKARLAFEQQKFSEVIDLLADVDFSGLYFPLRAKVLLLRSYYEMGESPDFLMSFCNSFLIFLRRRNKKVNPSTTASFIGFVKAVRILVNNKGKKEVLHRRVKRLEPFSYKEWVYEKMDKL